MKAKPTFPVQWFEAQKAKKAGRTPHPQPLSPDGAERVARSRRRIINGTGNIEPRTSNPEPRTGTFVLVLYGQVCGGKNNMGVSRTGKHYPKSPNWVIWRDAAVASVRRQLPPGFQTITEPVNVRLDYVAGDKRRRDQPMILDAVWHVLERACVVADDTLLWAKESSRAYDKNAPRCQVQLMVES